MIFECRHGELKEWANDRRTAFLRKLIDLVHKHALAGIAAAMAIEDYRALREEATRYGEEHNGSFLSLVIPIVVIPDGTLWIGDYQENGARLGLPRQVDRCSYFVGQYYSAGLLSGESLTPSHIEFVTLRGLETLLAGVFDFDSRWFPDTTLVKKLTKQIK